MPTKLPRHSITETPAVRSALDELRAANGEERIDFGELVTLGARAKLARLRDARAEAVAAREWLAAGIVARSLPEVDPDAAVEVKTAGLAAHDAPA